MRLSSIEKGLTFEKYQPNFFENNKFSLKNSLYLLQIVPFFEESFIQSRMSFKYFVIPAGCWGGVQSCTFHCPAVMSPTADLGSS